MTTERANSRPTLRRVDFQGLPVNVEIEVGQAKSGTDETGHAWAHVYAVPYGELAGTEGADGDPVDVYLGPDAAAPTAYVVHQKRRDGGYDEDKVMLGFASFDEALAAYVAHGPPWGFAGCAVMTVADFREKYLADRRGPLRGRHDTLFGGTP